MKRMLALILAAPALAVLLLVGTGCGEKKPAPGPAPTGGGSKGKDGDGKGGAGPTIAAGSGKLVGRIVYDGDPPKMEIPEQLSKSEDAKKCCLTGSEVEKRDQTWIVGKEDKGVANVAVWLSPVKGKFEVKKDESAVEIDQPHCAYVPHVVALKPGQWLSVKNSAACLHNTKYQGDPSVNREGGKTIEPKAKDPFKIELEPQEEPVTLKCDIHKWMEAFVFVSDHPYIAVTGTDGRFVINNVPTGAELHVVMWHEGAKYFHGGKKGTPLKSGTTDLGDVKISAK